MENQMNVENQNTQQIGQNSIGQPVEMLGKPKINYWIILTVVLLVLLTIYHMAWFLAYKPKEKVSSQKQKITNTSNQTPQASKNQENLPLDFSTVWTLERNWLENENTPQGGTKLERNWLTVYIPHEAIPANSKVGFTIVPEPTNENLSNIYLDTSFQISGPNDGTLLKNLVIYQPLNTNNPSLPLLHKETLNYYFWDKNKSEWVSIPSLVNLEKGYALAKYNRFGTFSLRGDPINKAPKILSLEPNKIRYNQDVIITIKGENFQSDSSVNFGMGGFALEFVDSDTIKVKMKVDNDFLLLPGTYALTIQNPDGQGTHLLEALKVEE